VEVAPSAAVERVLALSGVLDHSADLPPLITRPNATGLTR
jgi:hypothetical protein